MIPDKWDWKKFSAIEKATYMAHVLAPVSLVVATIFSYLTWQEARRAQEIAQTLFFSQNAPDLRVMLIDVAARAGSVPALQIVVTNEGKSEASDPCVSISRYPSGELVLDHCHEAILGPNDTFGFEVELEGGVPDFLIGDLHLFDAQNPRPCGIRSESYLSAELVGRDAMGEVHEAFQMITICGADT